MAENLVKTNFTTASKNNLEEFSYPDYDSMKKIIKEQVLILFKKLNINFEHPKIYDIAKIFEEFSNTLVYDERISDSRANCARVKKINVVKELLATYNTDNYYRQQFGIFKQIKNRDELIKKAGVLPEKFSLKYYVRNLINQCASECTKEIISLTIDHYQKNFVESIYNTLILRKGVCFDFSNTFLYILNEMQIKSYRVNVGQNKNHFTHTFIAVSLGKNKGNELFLLDVTHAIKLGEKNPPPMLYQFGMGKEKLDRYNFYEFISFEDLLDGNEIIKTSFEHIDENLVQGLDKKVVQKLADRLNAENYLIKQELNR